MFQFKIPKTPTQLALQLLEIAEKTNKTGIFTELLRKDIFAPGEMVRIVNSGGDNHDVCDACIDLAEGSPYTIEDARKLVPHHWGCHCKIRKLSGRTPGWVGARGFEKSKHIRMRTGKGIRGIKTTIRNVNRGIRIGENPTPQQAVSIIKRLRKKRRMVAPRGARAAAFLKKRRRP